MTDHAACGKLAGGTGMKQQTIDYYNSHARDFSDSTFDADMSECRARFLHYLHPGQKILDAGCGSGRDAAAFLKAGYRTDAFDASESLCLIASEKTGIPVKHLYFEELEGEEIYDGIWACASLLHVAARDLPDVLKRIYRLLKSNGIFYASFKKGEGERMKGERYFHDLTEEKCRGLALDAGFSVKEIFITKDVRQGRSCEEWVNIIAGKEKEL